MQRLIVSAAVILAAPALVAQCGLPSFGTSQGLNSLLEDDWTSVTPGAPTPIGFPFPIGGSTYDGLFISDHGLISLTDLATSIPSSPPSGAWTYTPTVSEIFLQPGPVIAPYWSDHHITDNYSFDTIPAIGEIWVDNSAPTHCTVSWIDADTYPDGQTFSVSVTLYPDGRVAFTYDDRVNNDGSTFELNAIAGIGLSSAATPAAPSDISVDASVITTDEFYEEWVTTAQGVPNPLFDVGAMRVEFIPLNPGWLTLVTPNPACATVTTTGTGCGGLALTSTPPSIGSDWEFTLAGVLPAPFPNFVIFGAAIPATPVGLLLPDLFEGSCMAYQDGSLGVLDIGVDTGAGTAVGGFMVPLDPNLIGGTLDYQGIGFDLVTQAPDAGFFLSDGNTGTIGW